MRNNTLYLTTVNIVTLVTKWQINPIHKNTEIISKSGFDAKVIVRCRKDGTVNWDTTAIYRIDELVGKNIQFLNFKSIP